VRDVNDLVVFSIGVAAGALALFIPWIGPAYRKYVAPCGRLQCPHHGPDLARRMNDSRHVKPRDHIDH
jgi:hypothetical protein